MVGYCSSLDCNTWSRSLNLCCWDLHMYRLTGWEAMGLWSLWNSQGKCIVSVYRGVCFPLRVTQEKKPRSKVKSQESRQWWSVAWECWGVCYTCSLLSINASVTNDSRSWQVRSHSPYQVQHDIPMSLRSMLHGRILPSPPYGSLTWLIDQLFVSCSNSNFLYFSCQVCLQWLDVHSVCLLYFLNVFESIGMQ